MPTGEKLRVVYLDHVAQLSGGELALLRLLAALRDQVDAHVILAEDGPLVERLERQGHSVEVLPFPSRTRLIAKGTLTLGNVPARAAFDTVTYVLRMAQRLRYLGPDIVHTNSLKSGVYGSLAARIAGIPTVWHLRDRVANDYLPPFAVRLIRMMTQLVPDLVVANSTATLTTISRRKRAVVVPSAVEPTVHGRRQENPHPLTVGIVGRLAPWKGQDLFLQAFAQAFPDGQQRAVVIGAPLFGPEEQAYAAGLHQIAEDLGIADRVGFLGHVDDVTSQLTQLDVLVHASIVPEPFGQVVVEGMAAGLPVVAARAGGPAEIISNTIDGFLFTPADIDELATTLVRLDADDSLRARVGQAAVARAADFSNDVVARKMIAIYRQLR
jgi:glycosyltransferase involved in cell wall biosynthesis